jgi:hypothetical protein
MIHGILYGIDALLLFCINVAQTSKVIMRVGFWLRIILVTRQYSKRTEVKYSLIRWLVWLLSTNQYSGQATAFKLTI